MASQRLGPNRLTSDAPHNHNPAQQQQVHEQAATAHRSAAAHRAAGNESRNAVRATREVAKTAASQARRATGLSVKANITGSAQAHQKAAEAHSVAARSYAEAAGVNGGGAKRGQYLTSMAHHDLVATRHLSAAQATKIDGLHRLVNGNGIEAKPTTPASEKFQDTGHMSPSMSHAIQQRMVERSADRASSSANNASARARASDTAAAHRTAAEAHTKAANAYHNANNPNMARNHEEQARNHAARATEKGVTTRVEDTQRRPTYKGRGAISARAEQASLHANDASARARVEDTARAHGAAASAHNQAYAAHEKAAAAAKARANNPVGYNAHKTEIARQEQQAHLRAMNEHANQMTNHTARMNEKATGRNPLAATRAYGTESAKAKLSHHDNVAEAGAASRRASVASAHATDKPSLASHANAAKLHLAAAQHPGASAQEKLFHSTAHTYHKEQATIHATRIIKLRKPGPGQHHGAGGRFVGPGGI